MRGDAGQLEGTQVLVVASELTLTLEDLNGHGGLVVLCGGEGSERLVGIAVLRSISGSSRRPWSRYRGRGGDVDQQNVLTVALQNACLQCCTIATTSSGFTPLLGSRPGELLDELSNSGHTVEPPTRSDLGNLEMDTPASLITSSTGFLVALRAGRGSVPRTLRGSASHPGGWGPRGVTDRYCRGDVGAGSAGQFLLSLLSCFLQTLQSNLVLGQVSAGVCLHLCEQPLDYAVVPVVATESVVTAGCANLNGGEAVVVLADFQQGRRRRYRHRGRRPG